MHIYAYATPLLSWPISRVALAAITATTTLRLETCRPTVVQKLQIKQAQPPKYEIILVPVRAYLMI